VNVCATVICPPDVDPVDALAQLLEAGDLREITPGVWAVTADDSPDRRRRVSNRERQRRYRERHNGTAADQDSRYAGVTDPRYEGVTGERYALRGGPDNPGPESGRDRGVTGGSPLGGSPPVTAPPGHAGVTSRNGDALPPRNGNAGDARDAPTQRDAAARRYHVAGELADTSPLDDLERERARRGIAGARAVLDRD
jgi:hypothetical protein